MIKIIGYVICMIISISFLLLILFSCLGLFEKDIICDIEVLYWDHKINCTQHCYSSPSFLDYNKMNNLCSIDKFVCDNQGNEIILYETRNVVIVLDKKCKLAS